MEDIWRFHKKLVIKLPLDPTISVLGIYPEATIIEKDTCTPMFTAVIFTTARAWNQSRCQSTGEWIKKLWNIHIVKLLSHKKQCIWVSANEVDEPIACYIDEVSQKEKQKYCMLTHTHRYIHIYIWNLKRWYWWVYLQGISGDTDIENRLWTWGGEGEGRTNGESSMETYTLLYVK